MLSIFPVWFPVPIFDLCCGRVQAPLCDQANGLIRLVHLLIWSQLVLEGCRCFFSIRALGHWMLLSKAQNIPEEPFLHRYGCCLKQLVPTCPTEPYGQAVGYSFPLYCLDYFANSRFKYCFLCSSQSLLSNLQFADASLAVQIWVVNIISWSLAFSPIHFLTGCLQKQANSCGYWLQNVLTRPPRTVSWFGYCNCSGCRSIPHIQRLLWQDCSRNYPGKSIMNNLARS